MLINQDFSVDRSKYIGGSDIGAILGLSRYRSPLEVWMEKTGKENKKLDSLPLRFGSFAEEFVASEYARATGFELIHDESIYIHRQHSFMSAHMDRFVLEEGSKSPTRILECKTANPVSSGDWGEVGSDEVPLAYLCQCIWYMAITNINKVDLAVLFGNSDFRIYEIARDLELENTILQKANLFWNDYVLKDLPPPAQSEADCQALFSKGDPTKSIEAIAQTLELTKRLQMLNSEIDVREEEISTIKQNIMNQMGEAESLTYQGKVLATWKAPKPSFRLDSKRLELEHPEIANNYKMPVQNSRRLVIKQIA
ncbi:YqaJ viral recombinase family protein [Polynucleobacter sp. AP-Ainpum-60-G11]|uniref:YqaJ viral recombinase family nuclease n=1 Tax=Polynucleobacter sp. AP-Ainpum-60-G11 TaxID=2576926 RepID=UPI001BFDFAB5|nr:YqaJ viral recombinase family protein [Polynucleobacter sp. AP-Ainpum-60-G11]QWE27137.1 YqaJ viral recombinase family protein [Polynucleobacter sp. AP-Ainpum-60-G11]